MGFAPYLFDHGGLALEVIFAVTFVLWMLIIERYWYCAFQQRTFADELAARWRARANRRSHASRSIRACWLSQFRLRLERRVSLIKALVGVSLLLGLLGTVIGMIGVFESVPAFGAGGIGVRAISDGVTAAIIPAMAGMAAALPGLYFVAQLRRRVEVEVQKLRSRLALNRGGGDR